MSTHKNNISNSRNYKNKVFESDSSDRLLQPTQSPSLNSDLEYGSQMSTSNYANRSKDLLSSSPERSHKAPKALDLDEDHRTRATYNSLKNWARLASFDKCDLSPSSTTSNDDNTKVQTDDMNQDNDSRAGDSLHGSPTKKTLLGKSNKSKLSLSNLQSDGPSTRRSSGRASDVTPGQKFLSAAIAVHATVRLGRLERAKRRAKWAGKKLLVFMLSHIGLILVMLLYATAGGFLFRWLEMDAAAAEKGNVTLKTITVALEPIGLENKSEVVDVLRRRYVNLMWNETVNFNTLHPVWWSREILEILKEYENKLIREVSREYKVIQISEKKEEEWTIPASLLFSTTVITSIGYGDITPKTTAGKLVCIPYAIVGIPLTLICLANIGQLMAGFCRFAWRRVSQCGRICRKNGDEQKEHICKGKTRVPILVSLCIMLGYTLLGALIFSSWEDDWSFLDGFYFSFITLSTIGFGDFVPGQYEKGSNERRVVCVLYLLVGLAMLSMVFQLMIDSVMEKVQRCAKFFGLSNEQIDEEIKEINEPTTQTVNLIPPEPPKSTQVTQKTDRLDKVISALKSSEKQKDGVSDIKMV